MKRYLSRGAVTAALALGFLASPAGATGGEETLTVPCDQDNVECGDFPTPEEIEPETPCAIYVDGDWLVGETNDQGQCVCEYEPPPSTSTTVEETTTTTASEETTTTTGEPEVTTTAVEPTTSTTEAEVAPTSEAPTSTSTSTTVAPALVNPRRVSSLPNTGTDTGFLVATGGGLLALGVALVAARRRLT